MKKNTRNIPVKNYFIAAFMLTVVIITVLYIFQWINVQNAEAYRESYLINTNTVSLEISTLEELQGIINEEPSSYFIFTGYTGNKEEYELEKDLKPIIDNYNIHSMFYYLDITTLKDDENFINKLDDILDINLTSLPSIIFVKDGEVEVKIDKNDNNYLNASDFEKLLEIYDFEKSN